MIILLSVFFQISFGIIKNNTKSICNNFHNINCIEYTNARDKFSNLTYVNQHKVHSSRFIYNSTGDNNKYPLSNAFSSNDPKSFWAASTPNNDTFHNAIIIEFLESAMIEALLYYPLISTQRTLNNGSVHVFNGSPTKVKIYTSIDNKMLQPEVIFVGIPTEKMIPFQFVFPKPKLCNKIKLEFVEVTKDSVTTNMTYTPISSGITFLQSSTKYFQNKYSSNKHDNKAYELKTDTFESGKLGDNVIFEFNNENEARFLNISGNGPMHNYSASDPPLKEFGVLTVYINYGVTSIGNYVFSSCSSLTRITIPNSVTSISDYAFTYCNYLTNITIPDSVTSIGDRAFSLCNSLSSIAIPNGVTSIGKFAFYECNKLQCTTISNSVTSIGISAFESCISLTSVTIQNGLSSIGDNMFSSCSI